MQEPSLLVIDSLFHDAFGVKMGLFSQGYLTMKKLYHLVYDPTRWKRPIIKTLFKKRSFIYAITHNTALSKDKFDRIANMKKQSWIHPSSLESSTQSIFELRDEAHKKMMPFISMAYDLFHQEKFSWDRLHALFGNVNFDGDVVGVPKRVYQSLYRDTIKTFDSPPTPTTHVQD